jgi:competence protein ComEA
MIKKILAAMLALFAAVAFAAVDANKATQAELEAVKGIGPAISGKILDERKKAPFKDWNDMVERVKGVGEGNAAKFSAEGLTVNGSAFAGAPAKAAAPVAKKDDKPAAKAEEKKAAAPAATPAASTAATAKATKADAKAAAVTAPSADEKKAAALKAKEDKKAAKAAAAEEAKKAKADKAAATKAAKEAKSAKPSAAASAPAAASAAKK